MLGANPPPALERVMMPDNPAAPTPQLSRTSLLILEVVTGGLREKLTGQSEFVCQVDRALAELRAAITQTKPVSGGRPA